MKPEIVKQLATKYKKTEAEILTMFENYKKEFTSLGFATPEVNAQNRVVAVLKEAVKAEGRQEERAKKYNYEKFKVIITGAESWVSDFAPNKKAAQQVIIDNAIKSGKSKADLISEGLIGIVKDDKGIESEAILYPKSDQYKAGQPIPAHEYQINVSGLVSIPTPDGKSQKIPCQVSSKKLENFSLIGKKIQEISGKHQKEKSKSDLIMINLDDYSVPKILKELSNTEFVAACNMLYKSKVKTYEQLVAMAEALPEKIEFKDKPSRMVLLENVMVNAVAPFTDKKTQEAKITVSCGVPDEMNNLDNPLLEKLSDIMMYVKKGIYPIHFYQGQVISIYGEMQPINEEKHSMTINPTAIWCDDSQIMAELPKKIDANEKKEEKF